VVVAALIISAVAVLIACLSAWYTYRAAKANERVATVAEAQRADEIAHREAARAAARAADLRVDAVQHPSGSGFAMRLENHGPSQASNVRLEIVAALGPGDAPGLAEGVEARNLARGDLALVTLAVDYESERGFQCRLSWTDGDGEHEERRDVHLPGW